MNRSIQKQAVFGCFLLALSACHATPVPPPERHGAYYWQRTGASSSLFLQGPKAQQMLNTDISGCVAELQELERLGAIRAVNPDNRPIRRQSEKETYHGKNIYHEEAASEAMERERRKRIDPDGDRIRAIHLPYKNVEGCMAYKGWELVRHEPYDLSDGTEREKESYFDRIIKQRFQTRMLQRPPSTVK